MTAGIDGWSLPKSSPADFGTPSHLVFRLPRVRIARVVRVLRAVCGWCIGRMT